MESPWDDDITNDTHNRESHWEKLSSDFTNTGYREGITAGKEGALQEGFDSGFAETGAPLGREVGRMRGIAAAILALANKGSLECDSHILQETRTIAGQLADLRFSDIAPPDLQAEEHAREHMQSTGEDLVMDSDELEEKRNVESLEDMLAGMSAGGGVESKTRRPTMQDFEALKKRLESVVGQLGLRAMLS
ncbi:hypothetical protein EST38_g11977 [Candolleomyces aberdarensis]|uniref:Protein YAE1 n=1 Tax=Candolleomyces aberdarensis TaxID=2316362 RepID=A0A4Q2D6U1_9AGAR|nr:hypothetical protein EST38_g11977 [Candolleomyces aberdarensis]